MNQRSGRKPADFARDNATKLLLKAGNTVQPGIK